MAQAWCSECESYVDVSEEDDGIGAYDYCGAPGFDSRPYSACSECGGTALFMDEDCKVEYEPPDDDPIDLHEGDY